MIPYLVNSIGPGGAQALAEALKQNRTLKDLNIRCTLEMSGFMFSFH